MHHHSNAAGGRAFGSGRPVVSRAVRLTVGFGACALALGACSSSHHANTFGGFPSFLPKDTVDGSALHRVVDASIKSPDLASQGDTVRVHMNEGDVLVKVAGPEVPNEGLPYQSNISPATWTVTLSHPSNDKIPVAVSQFTAVDDAGRAYHPTYVSAQPALPATVPTSGSLTFKIITTMKVGEGTLQYAPDQGPKIPVVWDFVVEDD